MRIWMPKKKRKSDDGTEAPDSEAEMVARTSVVRSDEVGTVQFHDEKSLNKLLPNRRRRR